MTEPGKLRASLGSLQGVRERRGEERLERPGCSGCTTRDERIKELEAELAAFSPPFRKPDELRPIVKEIFDFWCEATGHTQAKLDKVRYGKIAGRLRDGYDVEFIKTAISNVAVYAYVVDGRREMRGTHRQRYDDITLICRDASHLERFAAMAPDAPGGASTEKLIGD